MLHILLLRFVNITFIDPKCNKIKQIYRIFGQTMMVKWESFVVNRHGRVVLWFELGRQKPRWLMKARDGRRKKTLDTERKVRDTEYHARELWETVFYIFFCVKMCMKIQIKRKLLMKKKKKKTKKLTFVWLRNTRTCLSSLEAHPLHHQHHRSSKRKRKIKIVTLLGLRSEIKSRKLTIRNNISRNCFLLCSAFLWE